MNARARVSDRQGWRPLAGGLTPAVATARGRRETNQDRVCALRTLVDGEPAVLLAVADGIGGLAAGEQAAELAVHVVCHYAHYVIPEIEPGPALRDAVGRMVRAAGRRIWLWARDQAQGGVAGCTLACALVWRHGYLVAHAGDSRCYRIDSRGATLLTRDHTTAESAGLRAREMPEAGRHAPIARRLTCALGWAMDTAVEITPANGEPGTLEGGGVVLACSDGLYAAVDEEDMVAAFHEPRDVEGACRRLVALAVERGSSDNASVAAVEVVPGSSGSSTRLDCPRRPS